jgi:hypothetical protein
MSALRELVASADDTLRGHALTDPSDGEFAPRIDDPTRGFVLEAVREGYLLHYDESRIFGEMDADLRLLAGDSLYALGLARLAESGDLPAVAELADLISACAQAESEGRHDGTRELWEASVKALLRTQPGGPNR